MLKHKVTIQGYNTTLIRDASRARSQRRIGRGLWTSFQSLEERERCGKVGSEKKRTPHSKPLSL
jgi:hypothetical protein